MDPADSQQRRQRLRAAVFSVDKVSVETRRTMSQALRTALSSDDIDDQDLSIYIGSTRDDLIEFEHNWNDGKDVSLLSASRAWSLLVNAAMLIPWRKWAPDTPSAESLDAAMQELEPTIHHRSIRVYNE